VTKSHLGIVTSGSSVI